MAENTKIEWADHTFNPWMGCTRVSPACDNCYAADMMDARYGRVKWGATVAEIAECANYSSGLDLTVGIRTGGGYAELPKSRWEIERYE